MPEWIATAIRIVRARWFPWAGWGLTVLVAIVGIRIAGGEDPRLAPLGRRVQTLEARLAQEVAGRERALAAAAGLRAQLRPSPSPVAEEPLEDEPSEGAAKWADDPQKLNVYENAHTACGAYPRKKLARQLDADANDVDSIAFAYADGFKQPFHQPAYEGCFDGMLARG